MADGVKVQVTRSRERLDWYFTITKQRLELNENVFHCFNEVDTLKELSSDELVSFFKELDTRRRNVLQTPCFIFLRSLTQDKERCSYDLVSIFKELDIRR